MIVIVGGGHLSWPLFQGQLTQVFLLSGGCRCGLIRRTARPGGNSASPEPTGNNKLQTQQNRNEYAKGQQIFQRFHEASS